MTRATRFAIAAGACALLAGWLTFSYTGRADLHVGPAQSMLVAAAPLDNGLEVQADTPLSLRRVPIRFAPPDALSDPADAVGERLQVSLPAGAFLTRSILAGDTQTAGRFKLRTAERAVTVDAVVSPTGQSLAAGSRIDLYASGFGGDQRTEELVLGAEVLAVTEASQPDHARPTIRLAASQVPAVVRADVFARELRAVMRQ